MADAQMRAGIDAAQHRDVCGCSLAVDKKSRVILPNPQMDPNLFDEVVAVAHQGDHFHRSSTDTAKTLLTSFAIDGWSDTKVRAHVIARCRSCLACIKLRCGGTVPRPLWYMVRATRPFEYLHLDFVSMPDSAGGHKHLLVIVDDLSLTTLLHPCERADADAVIEALLNH